jgi:hypothetical protein
MTYRDKIIEIDKEVDALEDQHQEISNKMFKLKESKDILIREFILEEKLLVETTWELALGTSNNIYLKLDVNDENKLSSLRDLCFVAWHDSFEIQDGISLHFDDGAYSLYANDPGQLKNFITNQSLKITATDVTDKVAKLSRQLNNLQEIIHQFNLKVQ